MNDREVLENNFLASPCFQGSHSHEILLQKNFVSATRAYNDALLRASNDLVVFCHQDIYFPDTWIDDVSVALRYLDLNDLRWGILGCSGMTTDRQHWRYLYSSGLGVSGAPLDKPKEVQTLDEIVLIMRRSSGLTFDEDLPHFHLYGTDICLRASKRGLKNYVISAFCIHNTHQPLVLPTEFYRCCEHIKRTWKNALPIQTTCIRITKFNLQLRARKLREIYLRYIRNKTFGGRRVKTVQPLIEECAEVLAANHSRKRSSQSAS